MSEIVNYGDYQFKVKPGTARTAFDAANSANMTQNQYQINRLFLCLERAPIKTKNEAGEVTETGEFKTLSRADFDNLSEGLVGHLMNLHSRITDTPIDPIGLKLRAVRELKIGYRAVPGDDDTIPREVEEWVDTQLARLSAKLEVGIPLASRTNSPA